MAERDPIYALADLIIQSRDEPHERIVDELVRVLHDHIVAAAARRVSEPGSAIS
jgi:hypothetical protein